MEMAANIATSDDWVGLIPHPLFLTNGVKSMFKRVIFVGFICCASLVLTAKIVNVAKKTRPVDNIYDNTPNKTEPTTPEQSNIEGESHE
jgi:hypothetical protein